jgi:hypothetical protein
MVFPARNLYQPKQSKNNQEDYTLQSQGQELGFRE